MNDGDVFAAMGEKRPLTQLEASTAITSEAVVSIGTFNP
jgi:hypothetical protein